MQQQSLLIPTEILSVSKDYVNTLGAENKKQDSFSLPVYTTSLSEGAGSHFKNSFSWEYFSNQLEFE